MDAELNARAAAMREALQEVWEVCSREHWPKVGAALEGEAGAELLYRLRRVEAERDALLGVVETFANLMDTHDEWVAGAAQSSYHIPDEDDDYFDGGVKLHHFRRAREVAHFCRATNAAVEDMEEALAAISAYGRCARLSTTADEARRMLCCDITKLARNALELRGGPRHGAGAPLVEDHQLIERFNRLQCRLRQILDHASGKSQTTQDHELFHALMVEIPDMGERALHGEPDEQGAPFDENPGDGEPPF